MKTWHARLVDRNSLCAWHTVAEYDSPADLSDYLELNDTLSKEIYAEKPFIYYGEERKG